MHSLPHGRHKLDCQLVSNLIQAQRIERALARTWPGEHKPLASVKDGHPITPVTFLPKPAPGKAPERNLYYRDAAFLFDSPRCAPVPYPLVAPRRVHFANAPLPSYWSSPAIKN